MKRVVQLIFIFCFFNVFPQSFLNGDFEVNTAGTDQINIPNSLYSSLMSNSTAFGSWGGGGPTGGDMDIYNSIIYCGMAQSGNWCVALTSGGTDAISLQLSSPLNTGTNYIITFYDRSCSNVAPGGAASIIIGVSNTNNNFGTLIYNAPVPIQDSGWKQRVFAFTAPFNALYITVSCGGPVSGMKWSQVDNFSIVRQTNVGMPEEEKVLASMNISPNPSSGIFSVNLRKSEDVKIYIYDFAGNCLWNKNYRNETTAKIDLSSQAKGIYFVELISEGRTFTKKIILD